MTETYKNIVFTKHAFERMKKRSIAVDKIWDVVNHPHKTFGDSQKKFIKEINGRKYQAIAKFLNKENKYLIISTWVRGEDDKQEIIWMIITFPFKLIWWIIKKLFSK
ncbi:DUF4258 domain-containing protein [Candidatus Woesebacteria bacterium]|nr:DUF4258 domain-containing protein [Candidatus Woesebacteria bacterium]